MKVRLTRKLADSIDGVDLSRKRVGRIINVGRHDAQLLIAEGWGYPADDVGERRSHHNRDRSDDRPPRRKPTKSRKSA
jgi:hypothetical protein